MNRVASLSALLGIVALLCTAGVPQAQAHNRSQSYSTWKVADGTVELLFAVKAREVTRLPLLEENLLTLEALLAAHLGETIRVSSIDGTACVAKDGPQALTAAEGFLRMRAVFDCGAVPAATVQIDSFFSLAPSHVHFARLVSDGALPAEFLFTDSRREHVIAGAGGRLDQLYIGFLQYLVLGIEHILGGIDHLAFLVALLLLVRSFRELAWIVTGFTVGHSITLSLAVLGHLSLDMWIIEALIGFSIALVALDNIGRTSGGRTPVAVVTVAVLMALGIVSVLWGVGLPLLTLAGLTLFAVAYFATPANQSQAVGLRPALTLAFGMVHGFGFANVLNEIGLTDERMAVALAGFNIGVELGQLALVALLWWLVRWYGRRSADWNYQPWFDTASAGLCGLGVFWFITRGFAQV